MEAGLVGQALKRAWHASSQDAEMGVNGAFTAKENDCEFYKSRVSSRLYSRSGARFSGSILELSGFISRSDNWETLQKKEE